MPGFFLRASLNVVNYWLLDLAIVTKGRRRVFIVSVTASYPVVAPVTPRMGLTFLLVVSHRDSVVLADIALYASDSFE